jgi:hypothetical protein
LQKYDYTLMCNAKINRAGASKIRFPEHNGAEGDGSVEDVRFVAAVPAVVAAAVVAAAVVRVAEPAVVAAVVVQVAEPAVVAAAVVQVAGCFDRVVVSRLQ